ncbi:MAG TPA: VanZ family protein [Prosthecobacter sp.]|nr:VanZ family protein [Prosthecobacter sp.]
MVSAVQTLGAWLARRRWPWWTGVLVWGVVLYLLSDNSHPRTGPEFPFKDKLLHCLYFSGGAFCFVLALFVARLVPLTLARGLIYGFLFAAVCGGLDEWHQSFTPGRVGNDWADWLADCAGGFLGGALACVFLQRFRRSSAALWPRYRAEAMTIGTHSSSGS